MTTQEAIAKINLAIAELESLANQEMDPARIEALSAQISMMIGHRINLQYDEFTQSLAGVASAAASLRQITASIAKTPSTASALEAIADVVNQLSTAATLPAPKTVGAKGKGKGKAGGGKGVAEGAQLAKPTIVRILFVHGIGDHHTNLSWRDEWRRTVEAGLRQWNKNAIVDASFCMYDDIVEKFGVGPGEYAEALWKLGVSGLIHGIGDLFSRSKAPGAKGIFDIPHAVRWTAGMVAQWTSQEKFRAQTRARLAESINRGPSLAEDAQPQKFDAIVAHSLGSLVLYDTLLADPSLAKDTRLITLGSQIGNNFVKGQFNGKIKGVESAAHWFHLFNPDDHMFTASLRVYASNFTEVTTKFDKPNDPLNHDALWYFRHANTIDRVWRDLALRDQGTSRGMRLNAKLGEYEQVYRATMGEPNDQDKSAKRKPTIKALLIGINDYPRPEDRLEGCVNDVFLVSQTLQEIGFPPASIRIVLDDRATAEGIRDRLGWLLGDARAGDARFLFYSGHGAQIPAYGVHDEVDHIDECLVPYDFDWSLERAVTDDYFHELYSQLPYGCDFVSMFDCCHSGGLTRSGSTKARGLNPPDDIRHRAIKWDKTLGMWVPRDFIRKGEKAMASKDRQFLGVSGSLHRLGGAVPLRRTTMGESKAKARIAAGKAQTLPFMPVLMHACQEDQLAYEYKHGVTAYGAFTYAMVKNLARSAKKATYRDLVKQTLSDLKDLGYTQIPELRGPDIVLDKPIPWIG